MYAYRGLQCWSAELLGPITAEDTTILIGAGPLAQINAVLRNGAHTYLRITGVGGVCEIVKATSSYGALLLERGQDGTSARPWPMGSCIDFDMAGAAIGDLINEAQACPTDCTPASVVSGAALPDGVAGTLYSHRIVIGGSPPFSLGQVMAPTWLDVTLDGGEIRLAGTPPAPGAFLVQIPLKSCGVLAPFFVGCIYITPAVQAPPV